MRIRSASDRKPMSTRAESTFIPMCACPAMILDGSIGGAGLIEATSNARAGAGDSGLVSWPKAMAATARKALRVGDNLLRIKASFEGFSFRLDGFAALRFR